MGIDGMKEDDSIFGARPEKLDRLLRLGLHKPKEPEPSALTPAEPILEPPLLSAMMAERPGSRIGRYQLLEVLGEGGMGVIYLARQEHPIQRQVAIKFIKPGMDSARVIARFQAEQQTLALMEHPHIARVYDAGVAPSGRPYFVMEYVQGLPITEYCDRQELTVEQRLRLFLHVCEAVQHAHTKGIIHRDLKPSNILVVIEDDEPVPKIIDFGIARALSQPMGGRTLFTEYGRLIGTPEYMSPELLDASPDIDTRTDIYSLGLILYQLLTGVLPFDLQAFRTGGFEQIRQIICAQDPPTPSTRLSKTSQEQSAESARRRQTDPRTLRRRLRGDLGWITLKALEKDRTRRYETVSALADDIRRHLACEPVLIRSPSRVYHLQKLLRKHRTGVLVGLALTVVSLGAVVVFSLWNRDRLRLVEARGASDRAILSQAREQYARANRQAALETIKPILASRYIRPEAQLLYASILVDDRQSEQAVTLLGGLLQERPEIAGAAHSLLARILWESEAPDAEKLQRIEQHRGEAEKLLAETAGAYFLRAMTALTVKEQLAALDRALELDPQHYESRRLRAFTYYACRKYEKMEHDAYVMTTLRPQDPMGYSLRAGAWRELGRCADAMTDYDRALAVTLKDSAERAELLAERCETRLRLGDYQGVLAEAREGRKAAPNRSLFHYYEFSALTALGDYDAAAELSGRIIRLGPNARTQFEDWCVKYVFDALEAGRAWHPSPQAPAGAAFLLMVEAEENHQALAAKGRRIITNGFSGEWSPDGRKFAFSMGVVGYNGLAIYDLVTKETELLIVPGKDPAWSPDGRYLAFVRECQFLRVPTFVTAERREYYRPGTDEEVWIVKPDGTGARHLAHGGWPSWRSDSTCVYYVSRVDRTLYSISITGAGAEPRRIADCPDLWPAVSPDDQRLAYLEDGFLKVRDLAAQTVVAQWNVPFAIWGGATWSPRGDELCLGAPETIERRTGLWIFRFDSNEPRRVLDGGISHGSWRRSQRKLLWVLGPPYFEIWGADLDPNRSVLETLGPAQTVNEHLQHMVDLWTRRIEADPADANNYLRRAEYYQALHEEAKARADTCRYWATLHPGLPPGLGPAGPGALMQTAEGPPSFLTAEIPVTQAGFTLGEPVNVNSTFPFLDLAQEVPPVCFSADGREAYMSSRRPGGQGGSDLWVLRRTTPQDNWGPPQNLGPLVNSPNDEGQVSISGDGLTLCFNARFMRSARRQVMWMTTRTTRNTPWGPAVRAGPQIDAEKLEVDPALSSNGLELYFCHGPDSPLGFADIYVSRRANPQDPWGPVSHLGPIVNSMDGYSEGSVSLSPDGLVLLFRCDYHGRRPGAAAASEIWMSRRVSRASPWLAPLNLGPQLNHFGMNMIARILPDGATLFVVARDETGVRNCWHVPLQPSSETPNANALGKENQ